MDYSAAVGETRGDAVAVGEDVGEVVGDAVGEVADDAVGETAALVLGDGDLDDFIVTVGEVVGVDDFWE